MGSFLSGLLARLQAIFVGVRAVAIQDEEFVAAVVRRDLGRLATDVRAAESRVLAEIQAETPVLAAAAKAAVADVVAAIEQVLAQSGI